MTRGLVISALIAFYALVLETPANLVLYSFLIGVALQVAIIIMRKFVADEYQPQWLFIFELVADGAAVFRAGCLQRHSRPFVRILKDSHAAVAVFLRFKF